MKTISSHFHEAPHTKLGWWAVGFGLAFIVLFIINQTFFARPNFNPSWGPSLLPFYGFTMLLCGLASGGTSLMAILRQHERSWALWVMMLPG
jgi:hypothetical protein